MQNFSSKEFHFLRNFNLPRRGKCEGPLGGGGGRTKKSSGKALKGLRKPRSRIPSPHTRNLVRNNREEKIDNLEGLTIRKHIRKPKDK